MSKLVVFAVLLILVAAVMCAKDCFPTGASYETDGPMEEEEAATEGLISPISTSIATPISTTVSSPIDVKGSTTTAQVCKRPCKGSCVTQARCLCSGAAATATFGYPITAAEERTGICDFALAQSTSSATDKQIATDKINAQCAAAGCVCNTFVLAKTGTIAAFNEEELEVEFEY